MDNGQPELRIAAVLAPEPHARRLEFQRRESLDCVEVSQFARRLGGQTLENRFAQLLRFAEKFLVFQENAVQLERLIGAKLAPQHHVAHVHRIGQGRIFGKLFQGGRWIVVIHGYILVLPSEFLSNLWRINFRVLRVLCGERFCRPMPALTASDYLHIVAIRYR